MEETRLLMGTVKALLSSQQWCLTTGGVNNEGIEVLRQLFRFAAKHQGIQLSVYAGRAWARLACNIQSSVSQCFLNRAGGAAAIEKDIDFLSLNL